jgi:hypothetical protein
MLDKVESILLSFVSVDTQFVQQGTMAIDIKYVNGNTIACFGSNLSSG